MKKKTNGKLNDELRPEYGAALIRSGIRGKYAERYRKGSKVVIIEPDVAAVFPDRHKVNEALRLLMRVARESLASTK